MNRNLQQKPGESRVASPSSTRTKAYGRETVRLLDRPPCPGLVVDQRRRPRPTGVDGLVGPVDVARHCCKTFSPSVRGPAGVEG